MEIKQLLKKYEVDFDGRGLAKHPTSLKPLHDAQVYYAYLQYKSKIDSKEVRLCLDVADHIHSLLEWYDKDHFDSLLGFINWVRGFSTDFKNTIFQLRTAFSELNTYQPALKLTYAFTNHVLENNLLGFIEKENHRQEAEGPIKQLRDDAKAAIERLSAAEAATLTAEAKTLFEDPNEALQALVRAESERAEQLLRAQEELIRQSKGNVFGYLKAIESLIGKTLENHPEETEHSQQLSGVKEAITYEALLNADSEEESVLTKVDITTELPDCMAVLNRIQESNKEDAVEFDDDATWFTLDFDTLQRYHGLIVSAEENIDGKIEKVENAEQGYWEAYNPWGESKDAKILNLMQDKQKLHDAKRHIMNIMKAACTIKKRNLSDYLKEYTRHELDMLRMQTGGEASSEKSKKQSLTWIDKFNNIRLILLILITAPIHWLRECAKYLRKKFSTPQKQKSITELLELEKKPEQKAGEKTEKEGEKQAEKKEGEVKSEPLVQSSYRDMFKPWRAQDKTKPDPHLKGHLLHQKFMPLDGGELHFIDRAFMNSTVRFLFGATSYNRPVKFILPSYDILFNPTLATQREEHIGISSYIVNPFLPLAMMAAIVHERIDIAREKARKNGNKHYANFLTACDIVWWCLRGPLLGLSVAVNMLLVATVFVAAITVIAAVVMTSAALTFGVLVFAAPVWIIGEVYKLFKSDDVEQSNTNDDSKDKKPLSLDKSSPLKGNKSETEEENTNEGKTLDPAPKNEAQGMGVAPTMD